MHRIQKIISVIFISVLLSFCGTFTAKADDLGIVGPGGTDPLTLSEKFEQGTERYLHFKTSPEQTEYIFSIENIHAGTTSFDFAVTGTEYPFTPLYSKPISVEDKTFTKTLTLVPDTEYFIELKNFVSADSSVVPEVKISISCPEPDKVTLDKSIVLLKKGNKSTLKAVYTTDNSDKSITWKSSNTKVAKVSSGGVVTAVGYGTATITCSSKSDSDLTATCKVIVTVDATNISISKDKISVEEGSQINLNAAIKPSNAENQPVIWKSSDDSIVKVSSDGVVTGIKKGTAKITATVKYRNKNTVTDTCLVIVKENKTKDISDVEFTLGHGDSNVTMIYDYSSGNCYKATGYYTLKVGKYKGDLNITFKLSGGSDTKTIKVEPNSTYSLTYVYGFIEFPGIVVTVPKTTYILDPASGTSRPITSYETKTNPASPSDSDLSITVSGKVCENIVSAAGTFEKGELTCKKNK